MKKLGIKKGDIIILAVVLCIAALSVLCINLFNHTGNVAVVEVNGSVVCELPLDEDCVYDVKINDTVTNTVVVNGGEVEVKNANCPDKICQNHSPINKTGESIICLPNKVIVTIKGDSTEIDGVAQ